MAKDKKQPIIFIASLVVGVAMAGGGLAHYVAAGSNINDDKIQIATLKTTINQTKSANKKLDAKNKQQIASNNQPSANSNTIKNIQNEMNEASSFVLKYITALQNAKNNNDLKYINKAYLDGSAAIPLISNTGGDSNGFNYKVFGGATDQIKTVPSTPTDNQTIIVYAHSDASPKISFTATYDLTSKKIVATSSYSIFK